ncbi:hypothetical protein SRHO_G00115220 [Serrasalmus rhombeus]
MCTHKDFAKPLSEENVTASVLLEPSGGVAASVVQSLSKTLPYPELLSTAGLDPPAAKRSRMPAGGSEAHRPPQLAVLTVTDLTPLLTSSRVTCSILLHSPTSKPGPAVHQCGRVSLDIKDVLQGTLQPRLLTDCSVDSDESREDLLSLLAAFEPWPFLIESSEHTVVDVSVWLVDRLGAKPVGVSPQYLLIKSTQPSSALLFHWQPCGPFQALLRVHGSGQFAVLRFLDSLCEFLPASHNIQPLRSSARQGGSQDPASFLGTEIRMIKEGVASLLRDGQDTRRFGVGTWRDSTSPERLHRCREEWQREQERSSRVLHPLVDASQYRKLMDNLIQKQLDGDIAALVEAQNSEWSGPPWTLTEQANLQIVLDADPPGPEVCTPCTRHFSVLLMCSAHWLPLERSASSSNNRPPILFMLLSLIENETPPQKPASSHTELFLVCCFSAEAPVPKHARPLHFGGGPVSDYFVSDPVEDVEDEEGQREGRSGDGVDSLRSVHELPPVVLGVLQDGRLLDGISRGAFHRRTVFHARSHAVAGEMETSLPQLLLLDIHRKKEEPSFILFEQRQIDCLPNDGDLHHQKTPVLLLTQESRRLRDLPQPFLPYAPEELFLLPGYKVHSRVFQQSGEDKQQTHRHPDVDGLHIGNLYEEKYQFSTAKLDCLSFGPRGQLFED